MSTLTAVPDEPVLIHSVDVPSGMAAKPIRADRAKDRDEFEVIVNRTRAELKKAWNWYEQLGEVHFAVSRSARVAGYAKYKLVRDDGKEPNKAGVAATRRLYSRFGGTRALYARYYTCMKIPGDCYLVEMRDENDDPDGYHFATASELDFPTKRGKIKLITYPEITYGAVSTIGNPNSDTGGRLEISLDPKQVLGRVWLPGMQYLEMPDTPMLALQGDCKALLLLKQAIRSRINSRLEMDGILALSNQLTLSKHPFGERPGLSEQQKTGNDLVDGIIWSMHINRLKAGRGEDTSPIVIAGPTAEIKDGIKHHVLDAQIFETDLAYHAQLVGNILMGLDIQKQTVEGTQQANHWGAWALTDEERRVAVQPDMETQAWVFLRLVVIPAMVADGATAEDISHHALQLDLSDASVRSNMQEDARQGHDRFLINDKGGRRLSGIPEDEAPTNVELIQMFGRKHGFPYLAFFDMKELDKIDWEKVQIGKKKTGPSADSPADEPESGPGKGDPGSPNDRDSDEPDGGG